MMQTMDLFHRYDGAMTIVLGIAEEHVSHWKKLCKQFRFDVPHLITPGGETRFHTVKNALLKVPEGSLVAIHDAVRPLVTRDTIDRCFTLAQHTGAAIPCVDVPGSLRKIDKGRSKRVDRNTFRLVQTPQVFLYEILMKAYRQDHSDSFTDDAAVVEEAGYPVSVVEGNPENLKITIPEDLVCAESILEAFRARSGLY